MHATPPLSLALGLMSVALLGLACDGEPERPVAERPAEATPVAEAKPAAEPAAEAEAPAQPEPVAAAKVEPPVPGAPGPAYFAVDKVGVVRLDGGTFTVLADGPTGMFKGLQVGGDGRVWVAGFQDLMRLEGDGFKTVVKAGYGDLGGSVDDFAVTPDGHIWAVTFKGVSHHDGQGWSTEEKASIGAGEDLLRGVAVDAEGRVWVASSHKVHVREGGAWKDVDLGKTRGTLYFEGLDLGAGGSVYALASTVLYRLGPTPDRVEKVKLGSGVMSYRELSVTTNGGLAVVDIDRAMSMPVSGPPRTFGSRSSKYLQGGKIHALAADDGGRVWVSAEAGVVIFGPGDARTEWPGGSQPALGGEIRSMLVVGAGPAELPGAGAVRKGGLSGTLVRDGNPLAGVAIEICPSPSMIYSKTPCADGAVKFSAKTDEAGMWTVPEVPLGTYGIAVKIDGKWKITLGRSLGAGMKEGQVLDTGAMTVGKT